MKPSGILNFENVPADAGDPDVKVYVNGSEVEIGGGGDSDLTTCELTVTTSGDAYYDSITAPLIYNNEAAIGSASATDETTVYTIILYKGSAKGISLIDLTGTVTLSGDIAQDGPAYTVTGDAAITISA